MRARESASMNLRVSMNPPDLPYGVVAAVMERMTLGQPQDCQPDRPQRALLLKRLESVFRARGREPAGLRQERRYIAPILADKKDD
jgi:hypothetical protein